MLRSALVVLPLLLLAAGCWQIDTTPQRLTSFVGVPVEMCAEPWTDAENSPGVRVTFEWGDGSAPGHTSMEAEAPHFDCLFHTYTAPGTYDARVSIHPGINGQDRRNVVIDVLPQPTSYISVGGTCACHTTASFSATGLNSFLMATTAPGAPDPHSYTWDFGDGTPQVVTTTPLATHQYATPGTYTVFVAGYRAGWLNPADRTFDINGDAYAYSSTSATVGR